MPTVSGHHGTAMMDVEEGTMKNILILLALLCSTEVAQAQNLINADRHAPSLTFSRLDGSTWQSRDNGTSWALLRPGLVPDNSSYFAAHPAKNKIFFTGLNGLEVVSYDGGRSYWRSDPPGGQELRPTTVPPQKIVKPTLPEDIRPALIIQGVRPNPASTEITFSLDIVRSEEFSLTLEDRRGLCVLTIFNGALPVGAQQLRAKVAHLPDGLYNYVLHTGHRVASANVIVLHK